MNDWNTPDGRETACRTVLENAMTHPNTKADLLDPTKAKTTLETLGSTKLPAGMTVTFVKQEDKPNILIMQIPAANPPSFEPIAKPGFATCFLGLWITYSSQFQDFRQLVKLSQQYEMKDL